MQPELELLELESRKQKGLWGHQLCFSYAKRIIKEKKHNLGSTNSKKWKGEKKIQPKIYPVVKVPANISRFAMHDGMNLGITFIS